MFLRCDKNKGGEGSLFQCLLAMAAVATTAMYFSPISEIWTFEDADRSIESTTSVTKPEQRQGTMEPSVDNNEACFHHECPYEDQGQLTSSPSGGTLLSKNLDSESQIRAGK